MSQTKSKITVTEFDRCPACKKKTANLTRERGGLLRAACGAIVCQCGNHYMTKSMVSEHMKQAASPIIMPDTAFGEGGLITA